MLQNLTIGITTYERQYCLNAIIPYHAQSGAAIVIIDGSQKAWKMPRMLRRNKNIVYKHCPDKNWVERLGMLKEHICTPFCVLRSDRRHQTNFAFKACVEFLQHNPEYIAAKGIWLNNDLSVMYDTELWNNFGAIESTHERVSKHMGAYCPTYYDVHQSKAILNVIDATCAVRSCTDNPYIFELVQALVTAFSGKIKMLPIVQGLSQDLPVEDKTYRSATYSTLSLISDAQFLDTLCKLIADTCTFAAMSPADVANVSKESLKAYREFILGTYENNNVKVFKRIQALYAGCLTECTADISDSANFAKASFLQSLMRFNFEEIKEYFHIDSSGMEDLLRLKARCERELFYKYFEPTKMSKTRLDYILYKLPLYSTAVLRKICAKLI